MNKKYKILLVDNNKFLIDMYTLGLVKQGCEVISAFSGDEALAKLKEGFTPDAIVTDIIMPGMDGLELIKKLRELGYHQKTTIIILSNLGQKEDIEQGVALGIDGYIIMASGTPTEIAEKIISIIEQKKISNVT